jgi:hypothetical protein
MTITTTGNQISYTGDGSSLAFAFPYPFTTAADLKVYLKGSLLSTGYTVTGTVPVGGTGTYTGGTVTFLAAPALSDVVLIYCEPDLLQSTSLPQNDPFPAKTVEKMIDKVTLLIQRLKAAFGNALTFPSGDTSSGTLPAAASRANKLLSFDSAGLPTVVSPSSGSAADLAISLASTASELQNAGQVGYNRSLAYAAASVGYGLNQIVNVPDPTGGEDYTTVQVAASALVAGGTLRFPAGKTYKLDSALSVVISVSGVTIDMNGCAFTAPTANSNPAFAFIPASLVASGRLTGADYPSSWKSGSTPLPMDGDYDTMMHESSAGSRLTNIVVKGARVDTSCVRTFLKAYSVDGLRFEDCRIAPSTNSALRIYHSSKVTTTQDCYFGGTGTYLIMLMKCMSPDIDGTFESTSSQRAVSHKGVMHPIGTSIFSSFGSNYVNFNGRFRGRVIDGIDGVFWDTTPNFTEDAVGARGGTPIGFTSGAWYGKGYGWQVTGSMNLASGSPGTNGNQQCRGVWMSAPHRDVTIDVKLYDASILLFGVVGGSVRFSFNGLKSGGVGYILATAGDSPSSTDATGIDVIGCRVNGFAPTGTATAVMSIGHTGGKIADNQSYSSAAGTGALIGLAGNFSGISDYLEIFGNKIFYSAGTPAALSAGSNNTHGLASDNLAINTSTGAWAGSGIRVRDSGAANALSVNSSDDSTGFAGLAYYSKDGTTLKAQYYYDAANSGVVEYVGAERRRVTSSGNFFLTGIYPPKDDGTRQTACRLFAGSGAPNNSNGANGDYYLRSDTPSTGNQRLYVRSGGAWTGIV